MGTEVKRVPGLTDPVVVRTEFTPEKQLKEMEDDVPGKALHRLWRSDYWLD